MRTGRMPNAGMPESGMRNAECRSQNSVELLSSSCRFGNNGCHCGNIGKSSLYNNMADRAHFFRESALRYTIYDAIKHMQGKRIVVLLLFIFGIYVETVPIFDMFMGNGRPGLPRSCPELALHFSPYQTHLHYEVVSSGSSGHASNFFFARLE